MVALVGCGGSGSSSTTAAPATTAAAASTTQPTPTAAGITVPVGVPGNIPDGTYQTTVTDEDLKAVQVTPDHFPELHGTYTFELNGGEWTVDRDPPVGEFNHFEGTYVVDGGNVNFYYRQADDNGAPDTLVLKSLDNGTIVLGALPATSQAAAAIFAAHPLKKVG